MNYIDLSCPAEIFRTALPTAEIPAATLTMFNLSDRVITSAEVLLRLLDEDGHEVERLAFRGRALNGRPHSTFLLTAPCALSPGLKSIEATVEKVWFADNEVWRRNPANAVPYRPNALPVSPALTRLKYAAGETAVGYPSMQEGLWVCICGRPNPEQEPYCARCGRSMEEVFSRFTPEAVEAQVSMKERQLDLSSRNMREDTIRLQRIREEEYRQKKTRRGNRLRLFLALLLTAAMVAGTLFYFSPWLYLTAAKHSMETGDLEAAKTTLESLGTFGGARELITECDWRIAFDAAEKATTAEELEAASALLRAVEGLPEAEEKANEKDLLRGRLLLEKGDWEAALKALALLPEDYEGREALEQDCREAQAFTLQKAGDYVAAREIWLSLGDRPGAREQAAQCVYEPAMALMETGDWDGTISMLSGIPDYLDSRDKTLECHYHKAEELYEAGDTDGAINEFLLAGSWSDAAGRCNSLIYGQAEELYNAGDLKGAQPLYASIPDYLDSTWKDWTCRYAMAEEAAAELEYSRTLELLKDIPDEFEKTGSMRAEAAYQKARLAIRQEDWETAEALLGSIDREAIRKKHADVETLYQEVCKKLGKPYPDTTEAPGTGDAPAETPAPEGTNTETGGSESPNPLQESPNPFLVTEDESHE